MLVHNDLATRNIEVFVAKYPLPRPGWIVASKIGHHTVRVRELAAGRTFGRRFDVIVSDRHGTVSALYERLGNDTVRMVKPRRMKWLMTYMQHMRLSDVGRIGQRI